MESTARDELIAEAEQLSAIADSMQCSGIELAALSHLEGSLWSEVLKLKPRTLRISVSGTD
jgi:hypothetical protein